ncbi:uncharacterized protein LOC123439897 [Hordeum vulgare subsp. vulgare]|uniref:uncharacterized protein LOC123439897 n=1 Tax=Hordeum vulgare subsp. vulgare TaxID=112509 RepID=UPI001D1A54AB|nr:uncharacterized protein LOC123439897 [Hordeum vulgare subsp. vulgare]
MEVENVRCGLATVSQQHDYLSVECGQILVEVARRLEERQGLETGHQEEIRALEMGHQEERRVLEAAHQAEMECLSQAHRQALADKEAVLARTLEEACTAREGYEKRACAWSMKEQGMLQDAHELNELLSRVFPKMQELASGAVEANREEQHAEGVPIGKLTSWTMEEVGICTQARLKKLAANMHLV